VHLIRHTQTRRFATLYRSHHDARYNPRRHDSTDVNLVSIFFDSRSLHDHMRMSSS
jgi:hypothetical protein